MNITVLHDGETIERLIGNPTLTSLDGTRRAPLRTILHESWSDQQRAAFGVFLVDVTPPEGQVWTGAFEDHDGVPVAVFLEPSFEERKTAMKAAVATILNEKLTGGYAVPESVNAVLAGKVLQTRDVEDRTNWLTSQAAYSAQVAAGNGTVEGASFRAADNSTTTVSFAEGLTVLLSMAAWGAQHYAASWALKDAIDAAEDDTALDAIDIEAGWPS